MEKTSLYFKSGNSNKEYHIQLDGGTVTVQYGRRGNALTSLTKCQNIDPIKAKKIYEKLINEKTAKGYQLGEDGVAYSAPVNPDKVDYHPQLLNEISDENTATEYVFNDDWLMQEKEDGRNIGIIYNNNDRKAVASNKRGLAISIPEKIINIIEKHFIFNATLCGEIVGDIFKVWDVVNSEFTLEDTPYIQRYEMLNTLLPKHIYSGIIDITKTAITFKEKFNLFKEMKEKNAEGVVFKRKNSLYTPGRPNSGGDQLKFKFRATCSVIAGIQNVGKRSVEMWLYDGLVRVNVGSVTVYPNQEIPKIGQVCEVMYLYAYRGGSLFQPVLKEFRDDVSPNECTISQLKYKRELEEEE